MIWENFDHNTRILRIMGPKTGEGVLLIDNLNRVRGRECTWCNANKWQLSGYGWWKRGTRLESDPVIDTSHIHDQ